MPKYNTVPLPQKATRFLKRIPELLAAVALVVWTMDAGFAALQAIRAELTWEAINQALTEACQSAILNGADKNTVASFSLLSVYTTLMGRIFFYAYDSDQELLRKIGPTLFRLLRRVGLHGAGNVTCARRAAYDKSEAIVYGIAAMIFPSWLKKLRVAFEIGLGALPLPRETTPFLSIKIGKTLKNLLTTFGGSRALHLLVSQGRYDGFLVDLHNEKMMVRMIKKQKKKARRRWGGYVDKDEDKDARLSKAAALNLAAAELVGVKGATLRQLVEAAVDVAFPDAARGLLTFLPLPLVDRLSQVWPLLDAPTTYVIGGDPGVGNIVFSLMETHGGSLNRIVSYRVNLRDLTYRGRAGGRRDIMRRQAFKDRMQRRLADFEANRLARALGLDALGDNADVVVFVGGAFTNQSIKNNRRVGGHVRPQVVLDAIERLQCAKFHVVVVPEMYTTVMAAFAK